MRLFQRFLLAALAVALSGPRAWADVDVVLEGVEGPERRNVEQRLGLLGYAESDGKDPAHIRRLHRQAEGDIRSALQAYGYYSPVIRGALEEDGDDWHARYQIDPGPPTVLGEIRLAATGEGAEFPAVREAIAESALRSGERLRHPDYEATKAALARAAYDNGYLDARFTAHLLQVDLARRIADVELVLETGPRYYFGEVRVAQEGLDPEFIRRYVPIGPGEPFEPGKLLEAQFVLSDLGYFSSVDIEPRREEMVERRIPVVIATRPRPPQRYEAGVGYGTDTGARLVLGAEFRRLNESGHTLRSDVQVSERKDSIGADYRVPLGTRAGESLGFATTYTDELIGDGESERYDLAVTLSRAPGDWRRQMYLKHQYEESYVPATGADSTKLLLPGLVLSRGELDDPIHARLGWSIWLDVHGGHEELVSDVSFLQGRALLRAVVPLGSRARLLGRGEWGASLIDDFRELPASQRFFAGGDQSVRGYAYQSLGPKDATGKVVGGEYLSTYSVEAEYRVWRNWGAAAFLDMGNADDDAAPSLYRGVGAGVRYRAPIGTLQVDLAHPLDGEEGGVRPHLGIRVGL